MQNRGIYIMPHQGLGDHIICAGIYREFAKLYSLVIIPVSTKNYVSLKDMLKDVPNIKVLSYGRYFPTFEPHRDLLYKFGYKILNLGGFNGEDIPELTRFDEWFYQQADVDFTKRWDSFFYARNHKKEDALFRKLKCNESRYIFVHDDADREFNIDVNRIPKDIRVIKPDIKLASKFSVFNYLKVIENAEEIHCIESSFCALVESVALKNIKYAHRYSRPEAKNDYRHEFTYKSDWKILF
jgi:hypothetical protein